MQIRVQAVLALALASSATAFCPAPMAKPAHTTMRLFNINSNDKTSENPLANIEKAALTFTVASIIAVSSVTGFVPPADAATAVPATPPATKAEQKASAKVAVAKLSKEEKEKIDAKSNSDLAQSTLKEYEKVLTVAKGTEAKATTNLKNQQKAVDGLKAKVITVSDKLSAARNQQMPQSAISELTTAQSEYYYYYFYYTIISSSVSCVVLIEWRKLKDSRMTLSNRFDVLFFRLILKKSNTSRPKGHPKSCGKEVVGVFQGRQYRYKRTR
jgi:hypothetical protein